MLHKQVGSIALVIALLMVFSGTVGCVVTGGPLTGITAYADIAQLE